MFFGQYTMDTWYYRCAPAPGCGLLTLVADPWTPQPLPPRVRRLPRVVVLRVYSAVLPEREGLVASPREPPTGLSRLLLRAAHPRL